MAASVAMGNKKTLRGPLGNVRIGIHIDTQIQTFFFKQRKSPLELKVSSIYVFVKQVILSKLQPKSWAPATMSEKDWQRYLADNFPKF